MNLKKKLLSASNFIILTLILASVSNLQAQVGISTGSITPDASAMLEVRSSTKGFLGPQVALTATNSASPVTSPATGLLVYNTATSGTAPNDVTPGFYYWDGASWLKIAVGSSSSGQLINVQLLTSGTSYTPTSGTKSIILEMVGGGGAGGGASTNRKKAVSVGAGGGAGGYVYSYISSISAGPFTYAIGAGGTGSAAANGGNGGATSITIGATTYTANGGSGGTTGTALTADGDDAHTSVAGGAGGTASNGSINMTGQRGQHSTFFVTKTFGFSGGGGNSKFGNGGSSTFLVYPGDNVLGSSAGSSATGYGAGGGGAVAKPASDVSDTRAGGAGSQGVILIYEYK